MRSCWPGTLLAPEDVPLDQLNSMGDLPEDNFFFQRFVKNDIRILNVSRIQELGENKVDYTRAAVSEEIQEAWELAVMKMRGDL